MTNVSSDMSQLAGDPSSHSQRFTPPIHHGASLRKHRLVPIMVVRAMRHSSQSGGFPTNQNQICVALTIFQSV